MDNAWSWNYTEKAGTWTGAPLVCGISSIPFGILLSMPINISWMIFDQNLRLVSS